MISTPVILAALTVALATAGPVHKRETECRTEGLFVGGTVVGEAYIENVETEQDCIEKCNALEKCNAVNYFPLHKACLPQEEAFQGEEKESLASDQVPNTVYIIVKGCGQSRRKREANCRLQDVLVGGSVVNNAYIDNVESEEACIEECNKLENCNAVNYWPEYKDCLPQVETLADPEYKDRLASREEPGTNYIVVKGCNEGIERPANILPAVQPEPEPEQPEQPEETDEQSAQRRKRDVNCKLENVLVGGSVVNNAYIENVETEEACIEECNKLETCNAVNYFPEQQACLPQVETLADPEHKDGLASREEPGTNYIVVKGCTEGIERPANILPPVEPEQPETTPEPEQPEEGWTTPEPEQPEEGWTTPEPEQPEEGWTTPEPEPEQPEEGWTTSEPEPEQPEEDWTTPEPEEESTTEEPTSEEESTDNPEPAEGQRALFGTFPFGRKKRDAECRKEKLLVGGELAAEPTNDVETEEACIETCKNLENCQAVNYFPEHKVCWPQQQSLLTDSDVLETREEEYTVYIIVKGCQ